MQERGSITASCGHKLRDGEEGVGVYYRSQDRDGSPAISFSWFCEACEKQWREDGDLFVNEAAADQWLDRESEKWHNDREHD